MPGSLTHTHDERILIGTAGWSVPSNLAADFAGPGTHLERYARRMQCAEINSSFYRPHRATTYARWAAMVPLNFRFSVKVPKAITHGATLAPAPDVIPAFLEQVSGLGEKLGALLVQLPPRRAFDAVAAEALLVHMRALHPAGAIALEARHASWFTGEADPLLRALRIVRVAADPAIVPAAADPGGEPGISYYRLHGSPRIYYSAYPPQYLQGLAETLLTETAQPQIFVIFDNTAAGAALQNALELQALLRVTG